jgi:hypothetical protein
MELNMSSQPRKRLRFQIHLSTAVVLMFLAGGLLWANSRPWLNPTYIEDTYRVCVTPFNITSNDGTFPTPKYLVYETRTRNLLGKQYGWPMPAVNGKIDNYWKLFNIAANFGVALGILLLAAILCEWFPARLSAYYSKTRRKVPCQKEG